MNILSNRMNFSIKMFLLQKQKNRFPLFTLYEGTAENISQSWNFSFKMFTIIDCKLQIRQGISIFQKLFHELLLDSGNGTRRVDIEKWQTFLIIFIHFNDICH